ncbi:hypothetical protein D3H64_01240 [Atopobacter sp. AH10]|nr:hypothetical protein D3H64_01240 [Atopobacter sp. AH10]
MDKDYLEDDLAISLKYSYSDENIIFLCLLLEDKGQSSLFKKGVWLEFVLGNMSFFLFQMARERAIAGRIFLTIALSFNYWTVIY